MKAIYLCMAIFMMSSLNAQSKKIIKYKKHQSFDLDELGVAGESGNPGDISVDPRQQKRFKNKIPARIYMKDLAKQNIVRNL